MIFCCSHKQFKRLIQKERRRLKRQEEAKRREKEELEGSGFLFHFRQFLTVSVFTLNHDSAYMYATKSLLNFVIVLVLLKTVFISSEKTKIDNDPLLR